MWGILYMRVTSVVAVVAPRTSKSLKMTTVFLKEEKICCKIYYTLCLDTVNRQNCVGKFGKNLSRRKTDFSERGLALKRLMKFGILILDLF